MAYQTILMYIAFSPRTIGVAHKRTELVFISEYSINIFHFIFSLCYLNFLFSLRTAINYTVFEKLNSGFEHLFVIIFLYVSREHTHVYILFSFLNELWPRIAVFLFCHCNLSSIYLLSFVAIVLIKVVNNVEWCIILYMDVIYIICSNIDIWGNRNGKSYRV